MKNKTFFFYKKINVNVFKLLFWKYLFRLQDQISNDANKLSPEKTEDKKDIINKENDKENNDIKNIENSIINTTIVVQEKEVQQPQKIKVSLGPESKTLKKYNETNMKYLKELNKVKNKEIKDAMNENIKSTFHDTAKKLGKDLYHLLFNFEASKENPPLKNLSINKSLSDNEFISIIKEARNHLSSKMSVKYKEDLKNKIQSYKKEILTLFYKKKIVKDLIEGGIINILTTEEDISQQEDNFSLLKINEVSLPLINLPFRYNNKVINLNKDTLLEIASSYIPVMAYKNSLGRFIKGFNLKRHIVKAKIRDFMKSHQIYFTPLKEDLHGITNHVGDIFINYKYLKQYFEETNLDNKLIIREKIVLAFLKELNQGLIKFLDEKKIFEYNKLLFLRKRRNSK